MGVAAAPEIQAALLAAGAPAAVEAQIVANAGSPLARSWTTTLGALAETLRQEKIANPAMILVRLPKDMAELARQTRTA